MYRLPVAPYSPTSLITLRALHKLEAGERAIPVLTELRSKLHAFRDKAQIRELYAFRYNLDTPIVDIYISSWIEDPDCELKPTWENFLNVLKEIGLGDIAEEIDAYLTSTSPTSSSPPPNDTNSNGTCIN